MKRMDGIALDRRRFGLAALAAGTALTAGGRRAVAQAAPVKIRVGWVVVPASTAPLVLEKKDILTNYGKTYVAEATRFAGTPPVITALAAGELDIGPLAFSSFGLAIQNANMDDLRVICDEVQDGVAGHGTNQFMVLKEGPVKTVPDLKGKVLATNAMGSAVDIAMRAMLHKNGLEANKDYTVVEAPFPAMRAMLAERKVDLISAVPPFSLDPDLGAIARTLFTQKDAFGVTQLTMWTARTGFIAQNRAGADRFSAGHPARDSLVHRPEKPRRGRRHRRPPQQGAAGAHGLGLYRSRSIPRPERHAEPGRAAEQSATTERSRPAQSRYRREEVFRSRHGRGSGKEAGMKAHTARPA